MSENEPVIRREASHYPCEPIRVEQTILFEIDRDPFLDWKRRVAGFLGRFPRHLQLSLVNTIDLLREHGKPLTQEKLLYLSRCKPGKELEIGALKKMLSFAVQEGLLTKATGTKLRGYCLPEWEWSRSNEGHSAH